MRQCLRCDREFNPGLDKNGKPKRFIRLCPRCRTTISSETASLPVCSMLGVKFGPQRDGESKPIFGLSTEKFGLIA